MLVNDIFLIEANVEPKALDLIDKFIHEIGEELEHSNPTINHNAFLKRLKKDIINNNRIMKTEKDIINTLIHKDEVVDCKYSLMNAINIILNP